MDLLLGIGQCTAASSLFPQFSLPYSSFFLGSCDTGSMKVAGSFRKLGFDWDSVVLI